MAKITRTFRLEEDLVKRFDEASEIAGIDKTSVVTEAIIKFVEAVEMKKFWNTDKLVIVNTLYIPFIGKATLVDGTANLNNDLKIVQSGLRDYAAYKEDKDGTKYRIDHAFATIDFDTKHCIVEYKQIWEGGLVEDKKIEFPIVWSEQEGPLPDIIEISVAEQKFNIDGN